MNIFLIQIFLQYGHYSQITFKEKTYKSISMQYYPYVRCEVNENFHALKIRPKQTNKNSCNNSRLNQIFNCFRLEQTNI